MRRSRVLVWCGVIAVGLGWSGGKAAAQGPAPATADLERRVRELEEIVRRLEAERERDRASQPDAQPKDPPQKDFGPQANPLANVLPPSSSGSSSSPSATTRRPLAGWDNGFFLRSQDGLFNLRLTGQIQADYRFFLDRPDETDIDNFFLRRARLGIEADVLKTYEFRFLPDFAQGKTVIQDSYINVHYVDWLQVEGGKFKQPFSYEQLIQDRFIPTTERSLIDQLVPARDIGLMVHGQHLLGDKFDYALSVSNGTINGDNDTNDRKDLNARVVVRPLNWEGLPCWLHALQIGGSVTTGIEQEPLNPLTLKLPGGTPFFSSISTARANGLRNRFSPEVTYFYGGFGLDAQYFRQDQRVHPAFTGPTSAVLVDVPTEGFVVLATYLVTGEERADLSKGYSQAITPRRDFDPLHPISNPGAIEVVGKVSRLHVGGVVYARGAANLADPTKTSNGATEMTLGFNWYLNRYVRLQFDWEHGWFDDPVQLSPGPFGFFKEQNTLMTRFQVIF